MLGLKKDRHAVVNLASELVGGGRAKRGRVVHDPG
jgi:hypothetical protein